MVVDYQKIKNWGRPLFLVIVFIVWFAFRPKAEYPTNNLRGSCYNTDLRL